MFALVRPSSPRTNLDPRDALVVGDLNDRASLAAALKGVRFLFHAAADYRLWARDPDEIRRTNIEGTRLVMEEALKAGVERIVYTSSVATLKIIDGALATEDHRLAEEGDRRVQAKQGRCRAPRRNDDRKGWIAGRHRQSVDADRAARCQADAHRPIIVEAASGRMPGFVDTGLNLVHVDDVAAGHLAALERGRIGERYILGGENVLLADMLADIAQSDWSSSAEVETSSPDALPDRFWSGIYR